MHQNFKNLTKNSCIFGPFFIRNRQTLNKIFVVYNIISSQIAQQINKLLIRMSITIRPIQAALTRNTSIITKMDPFVKLYLGGQCQETEVCKNGGQHPAWSSTLTFPDSGDRNLRVQVWDRDEIGSNDLVGIGNINLQSLQQMGPSLWVDLIYNGKNVGRVCLDIQMGQGFGMKGQMAPNPLSQGVGLGQQGQGQQGFSGQNPNYQGSW